MRSVSRLGLALAVIAPWAGPGLAEAAEEFPEETIDIVVPDLEGMAIEGQVAFLRACARCHGPNAGGLDGLGPPLIMDFYGPSERSDMDLILAIQLGREEENWTFGPMPPPEDISFQEQGAVVEFLRQLQIANGVE